MWTPREDFTRGVVTGDPSAPGRLLLIGRVRLVGIYEIALSAFRDLCYQKHLTVCWIHRIRTGCSAAGNARGRAGRRSRAREGRGMREVGAEIIIRYAIFARRARIIGSAPPDKCTA